MKPEGLELIDPPSLVREQVLEQLRSAIISGYFKPGTRLIERELCQAMGVSRTSIREVLRRLESERLIEVEPRRGPTVARLTRKQAEEIYEVRARLEGLLLCRFVERAGDADIRRLRSMFQRFANAAERNDINASVKATTEFYGHITAVANAEVIGEVLDQLIARMSYLRTMSMSQPGRIHRSVAELRSIVEAVEARDAAAAEAAAILHVEQAREAGLAGLSDEIHGRSAGTSPSLPEGTV